MIHALFGCALTLLAPADEFEPGKVSTIQHDGVHYAIRVPKTRDEHPPAMVFLHGSNMRGENYVYSLETARELDEWVLIGPTGPHQAGENAFNHNPGDERYVARVLEDVEERLGVALGRIYVGGHSQGAFLSHAVAEHLPERIDGVLAVSGGSWASPRKRMKKGKGRSKQPIPIALVHAQDDPVVDVMASVAVYDAYLKAKHEDVRLFIPPTGAHMFMRLPILQAFAWLELMNADDERDVSKILSATDLDEDPRTAWDAARRLKELSKGKKGKKADAIRKKIEKNARSRARDLEKRLEKAKEPDAELIRECFSFLGDYGMLEHEGDFRDAFDEARK